MRTWPLHVAVIAAAHAAIAEPPVEDPTQTSPSYEAELASRALAALAPRTGWSAGLVATGAAIAERGGTVRAVAVGGQLATSGLSDGCRYLRAHGATYRTSRGDEYHQSADVTTRVCLFRADNPDVAAPGFAIEHHVAYAVQPALSARRMFLRRTYTGHDVRVEGSAFEGRDSSLPYGTALFPYEVEVDVTAQGDARQTTWSWSLEGLRITPPERIIFGPPRAPTAVVAIPADELAVLGLFARSATTATHDVRVGGLDLGRIAGLRVGAGVTLDVAFGLATGDLVRRDAMTPTTEAQIFTPRGAIAAAQTRDALTWTARYSRDAYPTIDGALAVEDRLATTVEARRALPGLQVSGFAAHTQTYDRDGARGDWTAGAAVARTWAIGGHLSLLVSGEAARSYYARLDGDAAPTPELAARALALLSGRLGSR